MPHNSLVMTQVLTQDIKVTKTAKTKIHEVDFNNLPFGSVFSDHMLVCNYK